MIALWGKNQIDLSPTSWNISINQDNTQNMGQKRNNFEMAAQRLITKYGECTTGVSASTLTK